MASEGLALLFDARFFRRHDQSEGSIQYFVLHASVQYVQAGSAAGGDFLVC